MNNNLKLYKSHSGTVKISGGTNPGSAGLCAFHFLCQKVQEIEFIAIGANASHNAMKAMGVFLQKVLSEFEGKISVSFQPYQYLTMAYVGAEVQEMNCVVWKTLVHIITDIENEPTATRTNPPEPISGGNGSSDGLLSLDTPKLD